MESSPGQHAAEARLRKEKDPALTPVQQNEKGQEVFVKVCCGVEGTHTHSYKTPCCCAWPCPMGLTGAILEVVTVNC